MSNQEEKRTLSVYSKLFGREVTAVTFGPKRFDHSVGAAVIAKNDGRQYFVKDLEPWSVSEATEPRKLAGMIAGRMANYVGLLAKAGVRIPENYDVRVVELEDRPAAVEVASFCGVDLAEYLLSATADQAEAIVRDMIVQTVAAVSDSDLGIDSHPSNWSVDGPAGVIYIDFWPVQFREQDEYLVGFPQPQERELILYVASRYYTLPGVLRILRFNLARVAKYLEAVFFAQAEMVLGKEQVNRVFADLPETQVLPLLKRGCYEKVVEMIEFLYGGSIDDLREIALRLIPDDPVRLTELFRLTRLDFKIPADERTRRLARFKKEIIAIVRSNC